MEIDCAIEVLHDYRCIATTAEEERALWMGMEALKRQRWTPCIEMMPEVGKPVLATDGGFVGEMYINRHGQWQRYNVVGHESMMALDILWWMPLPEPPEEGGAEK